VKKLVIIVALVVVVLVAINMMKGTKPSTNINPAS